MRRHSPWERQGRNRQAHRRPPLDYDDAERYLRGREAVKQGIYPSPGPIHDGVHRGSRVIHPRHSSLTHTTASRMLALCRSSSALSWPTPLLSAWPIWSSRWRVIGWHRGGGAQPFLPWHSFVLATPITTTSALRFNISCSSLIQTRSGPLTFLLISRCLS